MGVQYGPWQNRARIWWQFTDPVVNPSTTSVTIQVMGYLQMDDFASSIGTYPWEYWGQWGAASGSTAHNLQPLQSLLLVNQTVNFPLTDVAQLPGVGLWADHYAANLGGTGRSSDALYITIPARFAVTPSGLTVTRVSDGQQNLAWTLGSTVTQVIIQRRTDNGSWVEIARPSGNLSSWSDTTTVANRKYDYRVAAIGGSGQSAGFSNEATIYTTPAPLASIVATRPTISTIQLDVTGLAPWATAYDVYDNGVLVSPSGVNVTTFPWIDASPNPAITHTYTIKSKRGALVSDFSPPSNTVQLQAPPNAPTNLSPNGTGIPASEATLFSWQYNPVDATPQSAYELDYRLVGAGSWTTVSGTTATSRSLTLAAGDYEWRVRTKGADPGWSPYSAIATATVITRPGVALTTPPGSSWTFPTMTVAWTYSQAQSRPQSAWEVQLLDASNVLIETSGVVSGTALSYALTTRLADTESYTVQVRAAAGGVWSGWTQQFFTVAYVPPFPPIVSGGWVENSGTMTVTVCPDPGISPTPDTESALVERSLDGGTTWEFVTTLDLTGGGCLSISDTLSRSCGETLYRVTAFASSGASSQVILPLVSNSSAAFLGGGTGFAIIARLPADLQIDIERGRIRTAIAFAGRALPVAYSSRRLTRTVTVAGTVPEMPVPLNDGFTEATRDELEDIVIDPYPLHVFRDMHGNRIIGSISLIGLSRTGGFESCGEGCLNAIWGYEFSITEAGAILPPEGVPGG